jgi:hypothetical protein
MASSLSSPLCTWLVAACMSVTCDSHSSQSHRSRRRSRNNHLNLSSPNRMPRSGNFTLFLILLITQFSFHFIILSLFVNSDVYYFFFLFVVYN